MPFVHVHRRQAIGARSREEKQNPTGPFSPISHITPSERHEIQKITRKKSLVPAALVAAVSAVALSASPASAATININVGSAAIPSGARCVYVTGVTDGGSSGSVQFAAGGSAIINSIDINPGERVHFDWRAANCAGSSIREDFHTAPRPLPSVWNING